MKSQNCNTLDYWNTSLACMVKLFYKDDYLGSEFITHSKLNKKNILEVFNIAIESQEYKGKVLVIKNPRSELTDVKLLELKEYTDTIPLEFIDGKVSTSLETLKRKRENDKVEKKRETKRKKTGNNKE